MIQSSLSVINKLGMHARASAKFVTLASTFKSSVTVRRNARSVNGKSIMGLMMLAAAKGSEIELRIDGEDEQAAMAALSTLVADRFDEDE